MTFTIPNEAAAGFTDQAEPDAVDLDIIVAGIKGDGVVEGCAVTAQGSPDMTVAVAVGRVAFGGVAPRVTGGNVTITAADATNPRFDLVVSDNAGAKSAVAGTAAANPVFPAIPANSVVLAAVYVPANDTDIDANQITDKRVTVLFYDRCRVTKSANQSATSATDNLLTWNLESDGYDTDTMHDLVTNNQRIVLKTAGCWRIESSAPTDGNTSVEIFLRLNGATKIARTRGANGNPQAYEIGIERVFAADDYVEVFVRPDATINVTAAQSFFTARRVP